VKICTKCHVEKSFDEFTFDNRASDGRQSRCKECHKEDEKIRKINNPESVRKSDRKWRENNKEKIKLDMKKRYQANPEKYKAKAKKWARLNPEKRYKIKQDWIVNNPEKYKESIRIANKKKISTAKGKLCKNISRGIRASLKGNKNNKHWEELVDFTSEQLKKHLELQFTDGMNWDNYGKWHLDHRIPLAVHNFTKPTHADFARAWALKNLQPMWAKENMSKSAKLEKHFQPRLALGA